MSREVGVCCWDGGVCSAVGGYAGNHPAVSEADKERRREMQMKQEKTARQ